MLISALFYVAEVTVTPTDYIRVVLLPVTRNTDPNIQWSKYTPSGRIEMTVSKVTAAANGFLGAVGRDIPITLDVPDHPEG